MLTEPEIRRLLAAAMAYDNRKPGDAAVLAWSEAAHRGRWTYAGALDAIHNHYAASTEFLMPGHITQRLRRAGGHGQPPPFRQAYAASPGVLGLADEIAGRKAIPGPDTRPAPATPIASRRARRARLDPDTRAAIEAELRAAGPAQPVDGEASA